jgi:hypothetical protein
MFKKTTTWLSIAPPTISHIRWGWDSSHWVPLMWHYLLPPHRKNLPLFSLRLTKTPYSLSGFSTSTNRSMRFCRKLMLSTSNTMINIGYHTSFKWETMFGYIYKKSALQDPIRRSTHLSMGLTLSLRLWVENILISTLHPSLACTQCSMWTFFDHILYPYWTPQRSQNN